MTEQELRAKLTSLTRDLILIPSTESRPREREHCFEFIHNHLDGLQSVRIDEHVRNDHKSMVVRPSGIDAPDVLLCGHLDVIDHPEPDCFHSSIRGDRIYGPGAGDMKGAVAILVELFRLLHSEHPGLSVGLALTSDEERGGADGVRFLCDEIGLRAGGVLVPDGGSLADVTVEEKGVLHVRIRQRGHEAHGARPWLAANAMERLIERVTALRHHFDQFRPNEDVIAQGDHWFPTCAVTIVTTPNRTPNRIPAEAEAVFDIRFPPPHTAESMRTKVKQVVGQGCDVEVLMDADATSLEPDPLFVQVTEELSGQPVRFVQASGASDGRFFRSYGIPVNLSRPLVGNLHAIDEWIDVPSMVTYFRICETYIRRKLGDL